VPKIVRTARPTSIVLKEEMRYRDPVGRGTDFILPAGEYPYIWEDKGSWYFENTAVLLQANITGRIPVSRPGGFAFAKEYDQVAVYLLCEPEDMFKRGAGELVVAMLPKRNRKIVSLEGVVPKEIEACFEMVGSIPVK
jgi:hypothetical protein